MLKLLTAPVTNDRRPRYGTGRKRDADRAMELLHKAVKAGYKDTAHMAKDTDLDPLRDRADFKKLLAELEKQATPKNKSKP